MKPAVSAAKALGSWAPLFWRGWCGFLGVGWILLVWMHAGCVGPNQAPTSDSSATSGSGSARRSQAPILLADPAIAGRVVRVDLKSRFVVIDVSLQSFPEFGQELTVFREDLPVAELRVTGPSVNTHIAADIIAGQPRVGDRVRSD